MGIHQKLILYDVIFCLLIITTVLRLSSSQITGFEGNSNNGIQNNYFPKWPIRYNEAMPYYNPQQNNYIPNYFLWNSNQDNYNPTYTPLNLVQNNFYPWLAGQTNYNRNYSPLNTAQNNQNTNYLPWNTIQNNQNSNFFPWNSIQDNNRPNYFPWNSIQNYNNPNYSPWTIYLYIIRLWNIKKSRCPSTCVSKSGYVGWCLPLGECFVKGGIIAGNCRRNFLFAVCCLDRLYYDYLDETFMTSVNKGLDGTESNLIEKCGLTSIRQPLIVGGKLTVVGEFPWQVSVREERRIGSIHKCGGAIIHPRWILTGAHCVIDNLELSRIIRAGSIFLDETNSTQYIESPVIQVYVPDDNQPGIINNDIALLELKYELPYAYNVRPVCLPPYIDLINNMVTITGWGKMNYDDMLLSPNLLKVKVPVISNQDCSEAIQVNRPAVVVGSNVICTGFPEGGRDACTGDSGGPVQVKIQNRWHIVGIVSWGNGCGKTMEPAVHTYIYKYKDWIIQTTGGDLSDMSFLFPQRPHHQNYKGPLVDEICYL